MGEGENARGAAWLRIQVAGAERNAHGAPRPRTVQPQWTQEGHILPRPAHCPVPVDARGVHPAPVRLPLSQSQWTQEGYILPVRLALSSPRAQRGTSCPVRLALSIPVDAEGYISSTTLPSPGEGAGGGAAPTGPPPVLYPDSRPPRAPGPPPDADPAARAPRAPLGGPAILVKRRPHRPATGGNKARKLEFLMADALAQEADTVITMGAAQSNHARQTGRRRAPGPGCTLVLAGRGPPPRRATSSSTASSARACLCGRSRPLRGDAGGRRGGAQRGPSST